MIETERLLIRPFRPDDFEALAAMRADPDVARYIGGEKAQSREHTAARFAFYRACQEKYGFSASAVLRKTDNLMIGCGGLQPLEDSGDIEIGYSFAKGFWGQGYATELAAAWLRFGFESAGLARIVAVAVPENVGSTRVMEKLGMRYEGIQRHYEIDCVCYAITRDEFTPSNGFYALHHTDEQEQKR